MSRTMSKTKTSKTTSQTTMAPTKMAQTKMAPTKMAPTKMAPISTRRTLCWTTSSAMCAPRARGARRRRAAAALRRGLTEAMPESEFGTAPSAGTGGGDAPGAIGRGALSVASLVAASLGGGGDDAENLAENPNASVRRSNPLAGARRRLDRLRPALWFPRRRRCRGPSRSGSSAKPRTSPPVRRFRCGKTR